MTHAITPYIFYPELTQNSALVTSRVYNPIEFHSIKEWAPTADLVLDVF